ncbi:MAG: hypothetical protein K2Y37_27070 [Pirellulales bacterium]|nr:hypothetical protein [Pirellulales bacterium]
MFHVMDDEDLDLSFNGSTRFDRIVSDAKTHHVVLFDDNSSASDRWRRFGRHLCTGYDHCAT